MGNLVIVAIPEEQDRVHKISSEKIPHLTLLFLGDADGNQNVQQIMQFVQHATQLSEHGPFYLDVERRGTLGEDEADVVFFNKRSWNMKWIKQFRGQLLQNEAVRTAYDSTEQYPEWTPHLTLGYPATPAKPLGENDHPLYSVAFDRIAVWTGDFEGPDFQLEWPERDMYDGDLAVAYSDAQKAALMHYGVKGMQWGVRKRADAGPAKPRGVRNEAVAGPEGSHIRVNNKNGVATISGRSIGLVMVAGPFAFASPRMRAEHAAAGAHNRNLQKEKKAAKKDKKWEKQIYTVPSAMKVHNAMAEHFNSKIDALNSKPEYKDLNAFDDPHSDLTKKYFREINDLTMEGNRIAVKQVHGTSPSGKKEAQLVEVDGEMSIRVVDVDKVKHADNDEEIIFNVRWDDQGRVIEMNTAKLEDEMAQAAGVGEEFVIEHYGVKGMKWGVRKEDVAGAARSIGRGLNTAVEIAGDIQFENMAEDGRAAIHVERRAVEAFNRTDLPKINGKPEYESARKMTHRLRNWRDPLVKQYRKEVKETYIKRLEDAANSMTNLSGTRQYTVRERGWELPKEGGALPTSKHVWEVTSRELVKHAEAAPNMDLPFFVQVEIDQDGFVTELKSIQPKGEAEHSLTDLGEEFVIEHYGVKGMRWGVTRERISTGAHNRRVQAEETRQRKRPARDVRAYPTIGPSKRKPGWIDTKGGEDHPATKDAIEVAAARQKIKKSGPQALTNKELKEVANRLQLEQRVRDLEAKQAVRKSLGRKFLDLFTSDEDKQTRELGKFALTTLMKSRK